MEGTSSEASDLQILSAVVKYCLVIISIPILSFFTVKSVLFDGLLGLESVTSNVYSAIVAVVILHIGLGLFIYRAYYEADKAVKPMKAD